MEIIKAILELLVCLLVFVLVAILIICLLDFDEKKFDEEFKDDIDNNIV